MSYASYIMDVPPIGACCASHPIFDGSCSKHSREYGYIALERNRRIDTNCVDSSVFLWKKREKQEKNDSKKRP